MKRVMIDLETLGVNPGCVILAVAAVRFDGDCAGEWFYSRIDLRGALRAKFHVEADTLAWWFRHGEAALEFSTSGGEELPDAVSCRRMRWVWPLTTSASPAATGASTRCVWSSTHTASRGASTMRIRGRIRSRRTG